ncbi:MAG TPA: hypothetical protein VLH09_04740, partial [Bryobacteraceae bacterium]|nr:hypothetical protein [Bryobacteraceae bacterium]
MLREASYFLRMARGWREFIRTPPARDPRAVVREHVRRREENFLDLARRAIYANASNPYHALLRRAGCGYQDLATAVHADGLDATLGVLAEAGVYLTHDEFKGRQPILRPGIEIAVRPGDFMNPLGGGALETTSSGSRSTGTITRQSPGFQVYKEAQEALFLEQFGAPPRVVGALYPILPSTVGVRRTLSCLRLGVPPERWFTLGGSLSDSGHYSILTRLLVLQSRLMGQRQPLPVSLPENDFSPPARWIARRKREGAQVLFLAPVSFAVRVAAAALESALDIAGTVFVSGAEALTEAKREVVERAGAEIYPRYGISELGWVACSCSHMNKVNAMHVMKDSVAVITRKRTPPLADAEVDSLLTTTLHPLSSYVLINVEMDDSGTLEPAACDCPLKAMGLDQQIRDIYSYGKLTGQGITLLGGDVLNVLEKSLPARFGGAPTDYQLVEREGEAQTVTELRVSPRAGQNSAEEV